MKLDPIVDNFMQHHIPRWRETFLTERGFDSETYFISGAIRDTKHCVMGELYGWTDKYEMRPNFCYNCSNFGNAIAHFVMDYETTLNDDGREVLRGKINNVLHCIIEHVKEAHPELLKMEKEIEANPGHR